MGGAYSRPVATDLAEAVNRSGHPGTFSPYTMPVMLCHSLRTLYDDRFQRMLKRSEYFSLMSSVLQLLRNDLDASSLVCLAILLEDPSIIHKDALKLTRSVLSFLHRIHCTI